MVGEQQRSSSRPAASPPRGASSPRLGSHSSPSPRQGSVGRGSLWSRSSGSNFTPSNTASSGGTLASRASALLGSIKSFGSVVSQRTTILANVQKATTITDPELLRGAPTHSVLSSFGSLFATSQGRSVDFELSQPLDSLGYFISHNWATPRWRKYFALSLRFNLAPAVAAAWSTGAVVAALTVAEVLDVHAPYSELGEVPRTFNCWLAGQAAFLLAMLFWQEMKGLVGSMGLLCHCCNSSVFLDKVCIHQTDGDLQRQGIAQLGGFLRVSEKMVVVYSDIYLRRLWTVYEVASFLTVHRDPSRILLTPTSWPVYFAVMMATIAINHVLYHTGHYFAEDGILPRGLIIPCSVILLTTVYCVVMRSWLRCAHRTAQCIDDFSIRKAVCFLEEDRSLVQENIGYFMRHIGRTSTQASHEEAMDAFDLLVREQLTGSLKTSFGRQTFPYWFITAFGMGYVLSSMDNWASYARAGEPASKTLASVTSSAFNAFAPFQFGTAVCSVALRRRMDLTGCWEACYVLLAFFLFIGPVSLLYAPVQVLERQVLDAIDEEQAAPWLVALVVYSALLSLAGAWLYRPPSSPVPDNEADMSFEVAVGSESLTVGDGSSCLAEEGPSSVPSGAGATAPAPAQDEGSLSASSDGLSALRANIRWDRI